MRTSISSASRVTVLLATGLLMSSASAATFVYVGSSDDRQPRGFNIDPSGR